MSKDNGRNRHELKYYISYPDYLLLKSRVGFLLEHDQNMGEQGDYTVSSLYFDDYNDNALYEKKEGLKTRNKYRIRVYNHSDHVIRLERKSKDGSMTNKESSMMTRDEYNSILDGAPVSLVDKKEGLGLEFYGKILYQRLKPKVIVEYDREAYISDVSELRITFDKNLRVVLNSFNLFEDSHASYSVLPSGWIILEVKFNTVLPAYIRNILSIVDKQSLAISKYVMCREKFNEMKGIE